MEGLLDGRYQLGDILGYGGMSEVCAAVDTVLQRDVAIKILRPDLARDPSFLERFRAEARNSARLNHPNIVAVYDTATAAVVDTGADDGTGRNGTAGGGEQVSYIVMELVQGQTLRDLVHEDGALYPQRAMHIMADVCAALHYSHQMGIVNRDVKPGNIMITSTGKVKVMDFGIARVLNNPSSMTHTAEVMGTAQYLAPEQARGHAVDARTDIYATGCVLYEAITGQAPFSGDSPLAIAYQHVQEPVRPPSSINPAVPAELDAVVLKALAKQPENRYQTAGEMEADLVTVLHGQKPVAMAAQADTQVQPVLTDEDIAVRSGAPGAGDGAASAHSAAGTAGANAAGTDAAAAAANATSVQDGAGAGAEAGISAGSGAGEVSNIAAMMAAAAASGQIYSQQASEDVKEETSDQRKPIAGGRRFTNQRSSSDSTSTSAGQGLSAGMDMDATGSGPATAAIPTTGLAAPSPAADSPDTVDTLDAPAEEETRRQRLIRHLKRVGIGLAILLGVVLAGIVLTEAITGVSIFASQVAVTDVSNMKAEPAAERLRSQGFTVSFTAEPSNTVPRGMVIRTDPASSTMVARGGRISLIVSSGKGPISVPDVRGMKEKEAREKLTIAGLRVAKESKQVPSTPGLKGKIVRLSVPMGSQVSPKQEITLMVGSGDASIYIPATHGMSVQQASDNLKDAGFKVNIQWVDSPEKRGTVVGTTPKEKANKGDTVTLLVSNGKQLVIPNLRGMSRDAAINALEEKGWHGHITVIAVPTRNLAQANMVSNQDPAPGEPLSPDQEVVLYIYQVQIV